MLALRKRPVSAEAVDTAIQRIEEKLPQQRPTRSCFWPPWRTRDARTKRLDKVAYIRFTSVYKSFEDVSEFNEAIQEEKKGSSQALSMHLIEDYIYFAQQVSGSHTASERTRSRLLSKIRQSQSLAIVCSHGVYWCCLQRKERSCDPLNVIL